MYMFSLLCNIQIVYLYNINYLWYIELKNICSSNIEVTIATMSNNEHYLIYYDLLEKAHKTSDPIFSV